MTPLLDKPLLLCRLTSATLASVRLTSASISLARDVTSPKATQAGAGVTRCSTYANNWRAKITATYAQTSRPSFHLPAPLQSNCCRRLSSCLLAHTPGTISLLRFGQTQRHLCSSAFTYSNKPISLLDISFDNYKLSKSHKRNLVSFKRRTLKVQPTELPHKFKMEWPKITLFGDSITRRSLDPDNGCWAGHVAYQVGSYFDVDARGFEGYNSKWALESMPKLFPKTYLDKVELFVIFFGHNDSFESKAPMHIDLSDYDANMRSIVKYLTQHGLDKSQIILITPAWYHEKSFTEYLSKEYPGMTVKKDLATTENYSNAVKKIGKDEGIEVVDFFTTSAQHKPLEELFCDGIHFSRVGAKLMYETVMPVIEKKVEAKYKKPLADLWHVVPFDQRPELLAFMSQLMSTNK